MKVNGWGQKVTTILSADDILRSVMALFCFSEYNIINNWRGL